MTKQRLVVLCPHFAPDTAPTGDVMTRIVYEMTRSGCEVHVVTSLPWYRNHHIEPGWGGRLIRKEITPWGSITRIHPFPGKDKASLVRRAVGFLLFSVVAGWCSITAGGFRRRVDAVIAMSPPLTLGLTGWCASTLRRAPFIFNIQDVFPDAAVQTGAITNSTIITCASWLERVSYKRSDRVVVLSEDLQRNVREKLPQRHQQKVVVIPNFVDAERITPQPRDTAYRKENDINDELVVMYAGNVGFSQSLDLVVAAAGRFPDVVFVINGEGSARTALRETAASLSNIRFVDYQPADRVCEVLASADIHVVPLRKGLGSVSVPSKTYSILAAGRPIVAAIDLDTEVPRILNASGAGLSVEPDNADAFIDALAVLLSDHRKRQQMGSSGRAWVQEHVSPAAVANSYVDLINSLS
jgi:colanic acid biosynthesis glycosyl transferase WcaI